MVFRTARRTVPVGLSLLVAAALGGCSGDPGPAPTTSTPGPTATTAAPGDMRVLSVDVEALPAGPLDDARLVLPDWGHSYCAVGSTQFVGGTWQGEELFDTFTPTVSIRQQVQADVSKDGVPDVIARMECGAGTDPGGYSAQVAAYTRDGSGWRLLGKVTGGTALTPLRDVTVDSGGTVDVTNLVQTMEFQPLSIQTHHFRWSGSAFEEHGSPTVREPDLRPADIEVTASPASLPSGTGDLAVTVAYAGGPQLSTVTIWFSSDNTYSVTAPGGAMLAMHDYGASDYGRYYAVATIEPPAAGSSVTGTFHVTTTSGAAPIHLELWLTGLADLQIEPAVPARVRSQVLVS